MVGTFSGAVTGGVDNLRLKIIIIARIMNKQGRGKRQLVLDELRGRRDHPTAEEVYLALRERGEEISLATVYRVLRSLAEEGRAATLPISPADRFDPQTHPHYHFHCLRCGQVFDLDFPYNPDLDKAIGTLGFSVQHHTLIFHGLCPSCQGKGS